MDAVRRRMADRELVTRRWKLIPEDPHRISRTMAPTAPPPTVTDSADDTAWNDSVDICAKLATSPQHNLTVHSMTKACCVMSGS